MNNPVVFDSFPFLLGLSKAVVVVEILIDSVGIVTVPILNSTLEQDWIDKLSVVVVFEIDVMVLLIIGRDKHVTVENLIESNFILPCLWDKMASPIASASSDHFIVLPNVNEWQICDSGKQQT